MKATDLLETQHRKVEELFAALETSAKKSTLNELANQLAAHMTIEQELFYPTVREFAGEIISESMEEHAIAELELKRLLQAQEKHDAETVHARVTCLKELIRHHVEEEESELFPKVNETLEAETLEELGSMMEERFEEARKAGYAELLPKSPSRASADKKPKKPPVIHAS